MKITRHMLSKNRSRKRRKKLTWFAFQDDTTGTYEYRLPVLTNIQVPVCVEVYGESSAVYLPCKEFSTCIAVEKTTCLSGKRYVIPVSAVHLKHATTYIEKLNNSSQNKQSFHYNQKSLKTMQVTIGIKQHSTKVNANFLVQALRQEIREYDDTFKAV
jgi:hypothetical protein